jgi:phospholipid/cholesterol/gamma-HCH transport system ATP-binding protein
MTNTKDIQKKQSTKGNPIIKIENLMKSFGDNAVLKGFNLELYEGENLVIMGKSGSGKSVCLVY